MCFLRGPLRWLTEQKNPKFLWSLENAQRDTANLAISRDFFGYSKLMFLFLVFYHLCFLEIFIMARKFGMGFFGDKFWSRDFFGFCLKPKGFFRVLTFASIWSSLSLEIRSTASGLELSWLSWTGRWIFHTFHPELIYILWLETVWGRAMKKPNLLKAVKVSKIPGNFCGFYWLRPWSPLSMGFWILWILASSILCKSPDYFIKVSFHIVVGMNEARQVQYFPDFNLESIFITKNIFIIKNPTDLGKTVETGVDPCLPNSRAQLSSWWIFNN